MLSITSKYALRALSHLASLPEGAAVLGRHIARSAEIPGNYLSKILLVLRNAGYLDTHRGKGGGYRLQKRPEAIPLIEIVELFEGTQTEPTCLMGQNRICNDENPCSAHQAWFQVRQAYVQFLNSTTIADFSGRTRARRKSKRHAA
jgi:Rrf2 family protein